MNTWIISRAKAYYRGPVSREALKRPDVDASAQWQVCVQQAMRDHKAHQLTQQAWDAATEAKRQAFFSERRKIVRLERWRARLRAAAVRGYPVRAVERFDEGGRFGVEYCPLMKKGA